MASIAHEKDYPDSVTLEYLCARNWITPESVQVPIENVPKYERLAPKFKALKDNGASINGIAAASGMCWKEAKQILVFAETGERPQWKTRKRKAQTASPRPAKYKILANLVATLRDQEKLSFPRIATEVERRTGEKPSENTVRRAYDHARHEKIRHSVEGGKQPNRGGYSHLGESVFSEIRRRLKNNENPKAIAKFLGCGTSSVYRVKRELAKAI